MKVTGVNRPRIIQGRPMRIAGIRERYAYTDCRGIPAQWKRFRPYIGKIRGAVAGAAYGVCCATENKGEFDYYSGVEVMAEDGLPEDLEIVAVPAQHYAVFASREHISTFPGFIQHIWTVWVPQSGRTVGQGPSLEKYDGNFNPETGEGGFEMWIPVQS